MNQVIVEIEKLVFGGEGLARTPEGVVLVAGVLPGEKVSIRYIGREGGVARAVALEILEASPSRRTPPCPHADRCGGCNLMHASYEIQLSCKREIFVETMARTGRIKDLPDFEVFASPQWGWRRRVQIKLDRRVGRCGFFQRDSNDVEPISACMVCTAGINRILGLGKELISMVPEEFGQIRCIEGDRGDCATDPVLENITKASTVISEGGASFAVGGGGFFQGNAAVSASIPAWAAERIGGDLLYDIYGGQGYFSILAGRNFKRAVLVEQDEKMVEKAKINFLENGREGFTAIASGAERFFRLRRERPDCILVDPPRQGLSKSVLEDIAAVQAPTIAYVSCDPSTQARDIGKLVATHGYRVDACAIFDLYPQTHHMETAVILRKA